MDQTMILGLAAVLVLGGVAFAGAFVVWSVVPLLAQLRGVAGEAERLLRQLNTDAPAALQQSAQTLKRLEGTTQELPGLLQEATQTMRRMNGSPLPLG